MTFLDEIRKIRISYRLACKRYSDLIGIHSLLESLGITTGITFEPLYELTLLVDKGVEHLLGLSPVRDLEIASLDPPTERAHVAAFVYGRGHLKTAMALDAIEILLVAMTLVQHALLHPVA
jgi:hypothetical protein